LLVRDPAPFDGWERVFDEVPPDALFRAELDLDAAVFLRRSPAFAAPLVAALPRSFAAAFELLGIALRF
jgi:hypothetical protein